MLKNSSDDASEISGFIEDITCNEWDRERLCIACAARIGSVFDCEVLPLLSGILSVFGYVEVARILTCQLFAKGLKDLNSTPHNIEASSFSHVWFLMLSHPCWHVQGAMKVKRWSLGKK